MRLTPNCITYFILSVIFLTLSFACSEESLPVLVEDESMADTMLSDSSEVVFDTIQVDTILIDSILVVDSIKAISLRVYTFDPEAASFELSSSNVSIYSEERLLYQEVLDANIGEILLAPTEKDVVIIEIQKQGYKTWQQELQLDDVPVSSVSNAEYAVVNIHLTKEWQPTMEYYGMGYVDSIMFFGGIGIDGNTHFISRVDNYYGVVNGWSNYQSETQLFDFASGYYEGNRLEDFKILSLNSETGRIVQEYTPDKLSISSLARDYDESRLIGVGFEGSNLIYGSIDSFGQEQIISTVSEGGIDGHASGWSYYNAMTKHYYFGSSARQEGNAEDGIMILDATSGQIVDYHVLKSNGISSLAFSVKEQAFYGVGSMDGIFGYYSLDLDGNENVITELNEFDSFFSGWSVIDESRGTYTFGTHILDQNNTYQDYLITLDLVSGEVVSKQLVRAILISSLGKAYTTLK